MKRSDHSLYLSCVELFFRREFLQLRKELKKGRLNQAEKILLWARLDNLDGNYDESLSKLTKLVVTSHFLDAQRYNVLSSIYDKTSSYQKAACCNQQAIDLYHLIKDEEGLYVSYLNLAINYSRLSLKDLYEYAWTKAYSYRRNDTQLISLIRSKASYLSKEGRVNEALDLLTLHNIDSYFKTSQSRIIYQNLIADILFRLKRYNESFSIYSKLHMKVKSLTRERIQYEYYITKSLLNRVNLPNIPPTFKTDSEYSYLWRTLLHLQEGEPDLANRTWKKIISINPDKYLKDFKFKDLGDVNCHFAQYYEFLRGSNPNTFRNPYKTGTRAYILLETLRKSEVALRKEVLIEKVWGIDYDPDLDSRFYKLIQRVKANSEFSILMKSSTYQIVSS